ncbi:malate dehydrogenase [Leptolyngbya valderiana BDU 20041]|uniref:malic enzyme-like NAD(P)-binding protein n=1 Tax=Baaleninema simplex TaxID=2862350 RepID=UPI00034CF762|nr:malic enzyme-like NAD(P)-binding protein [Baaleninema simplex]MDC0834208.1 NAD-dependent malic enzyme [Geitlerinema sp. CS-897]OAB60807.1 malate dehydrogenase [Leptolyngbya valderiana BDU 20041]PPT05691.1 NADP-dependent malic enzyme [Geitlerinema sp. FC II]
MVELTPNPSYSLTLRFRLPNRAGMLASVVQSIASVGGNLGQIDLVEQNRKTSVRDITVDASSTEHAEKITQVVNQIDEVEVLEVFDRTFNLHRGGKIHIQSRLPLKSQSELAMAYTPGVGRVSRAIADDPQLVYSLTMKGNTVAIVSDGSAVLGLGNLGPGGALPVMEGKAMLFKEFAGIDAFPICLDTQDVDEIVATVKHIAPVFGGVNLEDISAPRCFEVERRLREELDIPVFHDDQHGTAIVTLAASINALKLVNKSMSEIRIAMNGAGAAGLAIARLLRKAGVGDIVLCDSRGIISTKRDDLTPQKQEFASSVSGTLADAVKGADVFVGVSVPGVLTVDMVKTMASDAIVMAMANPIPEIQPESIQNEAAVIATGRSDYANQINNVLAFPGVFRGALDCRASNLTTSMYLEAASAIASLVSPTQLDREHIVPSVFDKRVATAVSAAVQRAARQEGVAQC